MKRFEYTSEMGAVHMHVNFCGSNALMSQHLLNGPKISPVFE